MRRRAAADWTDGAQAMLRGLSVVIRPTVSGRPLGVARSYGTAKIEKELEAQQGHCESRVASRESGGINVGHEN